MIELPPLSLNIVNMHMLTPFNRSNDSSDIMIVLHDGITLFKIDQGNLMPQGDIHCRLYLKFMLGFHVKALTPLVSPYIGNSNGYIVILAMNQEM
jgi:hypothetical protein